MSPPPRKSPRSWADDGEPDEPASAAEDPPACELASAQSAEHPATPFWRAAPPAKARTVRGGIQINATRGPVARTWWSARFLAVLDAAGVGGRLARGRTYARKGQTVSLQVDAGAATARVQGSAARPYRVRIGVSTLDKAQWTAVLDALAADASLTAAMLAGELPREVEDVVGAQGVALFPAGRGDLAMDCTCPDATVPCKHLAAVFYLLAERFDADPFAVLADPAGQLLHARDMRKRRPACLSWRQQLRTRSVLAVSRWPEISRSWAHSTTYPQVMTLPKLASRVLALRGRDRETVLDELRARRTRTPDPPPLPTDPAAFYAGRSPELPAGPPTPPDALLDRVPALPLAVRGRDVVELLRPLYRALDEG